MTSPTPAASETPASAVSAERVGVIGLGIIGAVWARNYHADGVLASAWNRSPRPGAVRLVADAAAVARASTVVHIVVADPPAVEAVLGAVLPELGPRHLVIQSTTIDADSAERFAAQVTKTGAAYVESPFMGSSPAAEARKTIFMMGGDEPALARAEPVLARLSQVRHRVGGVRQAATLKLSFNLQVALYMEAMAESLALARRAGIADAIFFDALRGTALWSGLHALKEPKLRTGDFAPQFSIKHMHKDARLIGSMARDEQAPLAAAIRRQLAAAEAKGLTEEDFSALVKLL